MKADVKLTSKIYAHTNKRELLPCKGSVGPTKCGYANRGTYSQEFEQKVLSQEEARKIAQRRIPDFSQEA